MTQAPILIDQDGPVVVITLNRPDALNAMSQALISDLSDAIRNLGQDDTVRAIILTGVGRAFSCGLDLKELSDKPGAIADLNWHGDDSLAGVMRACPHPIISAVNGFAITGGLELAMLADFIIAAPEAKFGDTHARVAITPAWGLTQVLPRLIGVNRARQMSLTGEFVDAETACAWGLVNEVTPPGQLMDRARAIASQIAETDRATMGKIRTLITQSSEQGLAASLALEIEVFDEHIQQVTPGGVANSRKEVTQRGQAIAGQKKAD